MHIPSICFHDVLIVGAGPVGLFLACELRQAGCSVLVLEASPYPDSPLKRPPFGLRGLTVPTIESLDRRGLLEAIKEREAGRDTPGTAHWMKGQRRPAGHFAGIQFFHDQIDAQRWPYRLAGSASNLATDMAGIETVLAARAEALGVEIRRGFAVEGFKQSEEDIAVQAGGAVFRGRWLVGADGARSIVRKVAGIAFAGTEPEFTGYSAQVELADAGALKPGRHYTAAGMYMFTPTGTIAMADFDGGAFHRSAPITREHVEAVLRRVSGTDVSVTRLDLATTWTDRAFMAVEYRRKHVLLAGDAAHIHSPLGGQGLNLGLGDAMNLGWKLAAVIRGDASPDLLDSYAIERQPIASQVLDWSRAQVALMRPSRSSRALEGIIRDLAATRDGATYFAERVWGIGIRYDLASPQALVGRSAPDFALLDGTRLNEHLRSCHAVLLEFDARPMLGNVAERWSDRLDYVAVDAEDRMGLSALLVRPDGIVAWACDATPDEAELEESIVRWLGVSVLELERPDCG
ncbi:NAD(P)-binding protein [Agrobacterium tumefaciens]|uniref:FAD-dependent monooxygenase n=1 Tax=Agrobacterium tumefaciens TaxID=358 RepID=UPI0011F26C0C|nr:FAD-dependent monooxygenase [Agrobacterium tumefaciens]KAA1234404.1 NAD(P)-binding protein [Agrobacterium tumefaciens]